MTRARRETPGGAGGVANDDPALGVKRGGAHSGPAEGPGRVREGGASPERRVSGAGVRGRQPPANDSWNAGPKGRSASWLVSMCIAQGILSPNPQALPPWPRLADSGTLQRNSNAVTALR